MRALSPQAGSLPWPRRVLGWWRHVSEVRRRRHALRAERAQSQRRLARWKAGEPICIRCGGPLGGKPVDVVAGRRVLILATCEPCQGPAPVVTIDWARCVRCGKKDMERRITAPLGLSAEDVATFGRLVAGPCRACEGVAP